MAVLQSIPGVESAQERAGQAWRLPVGATSPLWALFGAAAGVGVAYWWMTQWTRALNVEALAHAKPVPAPRAPAQIVAEPEPEIAAELAPEPEIVAIVEDAAPAPAGPDDLTLLVGIGPKLADALAARGVTRFAQIAAWTEDDLAEVDAALNLKRRAVRDAWVAQARRRADGS